MGIGLAVGLLLLGCGSPRDVEPDLIFVRGGWIGPEDRVTGAALGGVRALAAGDRLHPHALRYNSQLSTTGDDVMFYIRRKSPVSSPLIMPLSFFFSVRNLQKAI